MVSLNGVSRQVGGAPQEVYSRPSVARRLRLLHRVDWLHLCKYFVNVCRFLFPFFFFFHTSFPPGLPMNDGGTRPRRRDAPLTEERGRTCSCSLQDQSSSPSLLLLAIFSPRCVWIPQNQLTLEEATQVLVVQCITVCHIDLAECETYLRCFSSVDWNCFGAPPPGTSPRCFHFCSPRWCLLPGERVDQGFLKPSLAG